MPKVLRQNISLLPCNLPVCCGWAHLCYHCNVFTTFIAGVTKMVPTLYLSSTVIAVKDKNTADIEVYRSLTPHRVIQNQNALYCHYTPIQ